MARSPDSRGHADNLHRFWPLIGNADLMTSEVLSWVRDHPSGVMAAVALALSLWTMSRIRRARLRAMPFAHFATFHQSTERAQQYLVVGNHGPSAARDLSVTFSRGGKVWEPGWNGGEDSPFPIQALAPGNPLGLGCWGNWTEGKAGLAIATITWRDGRRRTQSTKTTLSVAGLPVGGWGGKTLAELDRGPGWRMPV
jgi:hypothetical protein